MQAASALGELREPAAVEPLLHATRDHNLDVRAEAGQALDALGTAAVVVGMSAMVGPMITEAVVSAVQATTPAQALSNSNSAAQIERPVGLLGVGGFQDALKEARSASDSPE